jgi:Methyltransferase domain
MTHREDISTLRARFKKLLVERNGVQRQLAHILFRFFEYFGFHIVGDHFYEPIPNSKVIFSQYRDEPRLDLAIDYKFANAELRLSALLERYGGDYTADVASTGFAEENYFFRGLDSIALYCLVREMKPNLVIEVGQGQSTLVLLSALKHSLAERPQAPRLVTIDPYARLSNVPEIAGITIDVIRQPVQSVARDVFQLLGRGDLLFVDSSHVYKFGSDVEFQFESIYPDLNPGVVVHIHDIFSPYMYPKAWYLKKRRFWNEQYMFEQFLSGSRLFEILLPINYLARKSARVRASTEKICTHPFYKHEGTSMYVVATAAPANSH